MNSWTLILRSLRFHARAHLGVALGAAVGSAALVGALVVGDSVRESLHDMALARLGRTETALVSGDRLFRAQLANDISNAARNSNNPPSTAAVLQLPGTAATQDASARANHVQILGVNQSFWQLANQPLALKNLPADAVVLSQALAGQLHAKLGDTILLRIQKPSLLSRDAPISPQEDLSVAWRVKVQAIVSDEQLGRFSLQANQIAPFNAFVDLDQLQQKISQPGRANLLLYADNLNSTNSTAAANAALAERWQLADAELDLRELTNHTGVELRSARVFLDPITATAAKNISPDAQPIITYLVNDIASPPFATPYSMVTAMGAPVVPADMRDDEILVNDWLAQDLQAQSGDAVSLTYFVIGNGRALEERSAKFHVRAIVPMTGPTADRTLMPDFPGLSQAESTSDWDAGFPIDLKRIRPKDEQYWKQFRGTPKAFVTVAAGEKMWSNRFGDYTAIRFPTSAGSLESIRAELLKRISPASVGLAFMPVRAQALAASSQAVDFGGLFIGFSFFLIVAALLLMGLLFQFGLEQRATEVGTLLALGFRPRQVRRLFLGEGSLLAFVGGIVGVAGGIIYARAMLLGLTTIWRHAVGTSSLQFHATPLSLVMGALASTAVAILTIWITLRQQARRPARELLAGGSQNFGTKRRKRSWGFWIGIFAALGAAGIIGPAVWQSDKASADTFFSGGSLLLIAALGFCAAWLASAAKENHSATSNTAAKNFTLGELSLRNCGRRRKRSLATIGLLACGIFLIMAIGAFRMDANQTANSPSSGTGGFDLIGESSLPVTYDLNSRAGRDFYNLDSPLMKNVRVVPFRIHEGDEASCLNLNHAQTPRLLGVNAAALQMRHAFTFTQVMPGASTDQGWDLLGSTNSENGLNTNAPVLAADEIAGVGDENSILWAMGKKVGDTVNYVDSRGRPFKVRLVGQIANSILQGSLIIDETAFLKRFPDESGYRMFLITAPGDKQSETASFLSHALQDVGLELTPATARLNQFNAVQNTYLSTFQVLGGLGLLLGSAGLGIVVLRNVQERRGELALLLAVGFRRRQLLKMILTEHAALLILGLFAGTLAAAIAVLPTLLSPGARLPHLSLAVTAGVVLLNGLAWAWLATSSRCGEDCWTH